MNPDELFKGLEKVAAVADSGNNTPNRTHTIFNFARPESRRIRNSMSRQLVEAPSELWHLDTDLIDVDLGELDCNSPNKTKM